MTRNDDGADQDDAVNSVGSGHQGRVESARDLRDDFKSDEHRQDEVGQDDNRFHYLAPFLAPDCNASAVGW